MDILSFFSTNKSPTTWLSPTITIKDVAGTEYVLNWNMSEVGEWFYNYEFEADEAVSYIIISDWWDDNLDSRTTYWWWQIIEEASAKNIKDIENYVIWANRGVEAIINKINKETKEANEWLFENVIAKLEQWTNKETIKETTVIENKIDVKQIVEDLVWALEEQKKEEEKRNKKLIKELKWLFVEGDSLASLFPSQEEALLLNLFKN